MYNCSNDKTLKVAQSFIGKSNCLIKIYKNTYNLGYAQNFSKAMEMCNGDIVFLSDQDDFWYPKKIEIMMKYLSNHPTVDLVMCDAMFADQYLNPINLTKLQNIHINNLSISTFVMGCCIAARTSFLSNFLPIPAGYPSHDNWICLFAEALGTKAIIHEPLQLYRRHSHNTSQWSINNIHSSHKLINLISYLKYKLFSNRTEKNHKRNKTYLANKILYRWLCNNLDSISCEIYKNNFKKLKIKTRRVKNYQYLRKKIREGHLPYKINLIYKLVASNSRFYSVSLTAMISDLFKL